MPTNPQAGLDSEMGSTSDHAQPGVLGLNVADTPPGVGVRGEGPVGVEGFGTGNPGGIGVNGKANVGVLGIGEIFSFNEANVDQTDVRARGVQGEIQILDRASTTISLGFLAGRDPTFKQHAGVYGESDQQGVIGLTTVPKGTGVYGGGTTAAGGDQIGVRGETFNGFGVMGKSFGGGNGVVGISNAGTGVQGTNGDHASAPFVPDRGCGIFGESVNGFGVFASSDNHFGVKAVSKNGVGLSAEGPRLAAFFRGNVEVTGNLNMSSPSSDITLGDIAESFSSNEGEIVEPGTVVVLNQQGLLRPSDEAYDKKVAGVVSGAGDYRPAIVLDKQRSHAGQLPVALMGKVCCKVDAQYSPIEVGDLLTTSPTLGHAMKATDPLRAFGSVIGKALGPLNVGQGMIPILVALQ